MTDPGRPKFIDEISGSVRRPNPPSNVKVGMLGTTRDGRSSFTANARGDIPFRLSADARIG